MASTIQVVMGWGSLALATDRLNALSIELDNSQGAVSAFPAGMRMTYLEQTYVLTCAPAKIFSVFPGIATSGGYAAQLALRAGTPITVMMLTLTPLVGGAAVVFYFSDQVVPNVDTLYQSALFAGMIDTWSYTLNKFTLALTGTDHKEDKLVPRNLVTLYDWPNCGQSIGKAFPEVYGAPGPVPDNAGGTYSLSPGFGAAPCVLVDRAALKYIVAGHAVTLIGGAASGLVNLWVKLPGYDGGYAVIKNCSLVLSQDFHPVFGGGSTDGQIAYITLPTPVWADLYLPSLDAGTYFANTASNPTGACGNGGYQPFPLSNGLPAVIALGQTLELFLGTGFATTGIQILRVFIAASGANSALQANWVGPQANVVSHGAGYIGIDSSAGWDASGKVRVGSGDYSYTSIVAASSSEFRLQIAGYAGTDSGLATMCGTAQALNTAEVEVTTQRNWDGGDFYKFELQLSNSSGVPAAISWLGLHIQVEVTGYPDVFAPVSGVDIVLHSTDYGSSRNPAVQMAGVYKRLEGLADGDIGSTFDTVLASLAALKWDWSLPAQAQTSKVLADMLAQSQMFTWRDGANAVQVGLYKLDAVATLTLAALVDVIDPVGDAFRIEWTQPEQVYNRVVVNWGYNHAASKYQQSYRIHELGCVPSDTARQAAALASQSQTGMQNTLSVDASFVQDGATALALLQFLFDFWSARRRIVTFQVPMHAGVVPGTFFSVTHPLLSAAETYLIKSVGRSGDVLTVTALFIAYGAQATDQIACKMQGAESVDSLWGAPGFFNPWGGANISAVAAATGLVTDHGLAAFAARIAGSGTEKPLFAGIGSSATAAAPGDVSLVAQIGARAGISSGYPSRSAGTVTWRFAFVNNSGASWTVNELGLFGDAAGSSLEARLVLGSPLTIAAGNTLSLTLTVQVLRPSGGSALTDYGCGIFAERIFNDAQAVPADYAIGTSGTAESGADVALGAQVGSRVALTPGTPFAQGKIIQFRAYFNGSIYGGQTIRELGIFGDVAGNTAEIRNVSAAPIVVGAGASLSVVHNLDLVNYS